MSKEKATYYLRVRTYPQGPHERFVTVWLVRSTGQGTKESPRVDSSLLWGELIPEAMREMAAATGLKVVEEHCPYQLQPLNPAETRSLVEQRSLFEE